MVLFAPIPQGSDEYSLSIAQIQTAQIQIPQIQTAQIQIPQIQIPQIQTAQIQIAQIQIAQAQTTQAQTTQAQMTQTQTIQPQMTQTQTIQPQMNKMIRTVQVSTAGITLDAYLAQPEGEGPFPGIVVLQEIFGVNAHIREVTERLAQAGYVAIAPSLYQRTAPGFEVGYTEADTVLGRQYKEQTHASELLGDIQASLEFLKGQHSVKPSRFGCIGFCFGGHVAYLAATLPDITATAVFYGGGIATMTPGGGPPTLTRTQEIKGTLYGFFGTQDPLIPNDQVDAIEAELQRCQVSHRLFRYEAGHGFFCDQRADYRPEAAADAWSHTLALFREQL